MADPLPDRISGYQPPHSFPDSTSSLGSCVDIPDDSLDVLMTMVAATDLTMQAPSPSPKGGGWISESASPTLHYNAGAYAGVYLQSPMLDAGYLMMTSPTNPLFQALDSDFANDLRQNISFRSDYAPVNSNQFIPPLDVSWPTSSRDLPSRGELFPTRATQNHDQEPDRTLLPRFTSEEPSTAGTYHIKPTCLLPNYNGVNTRLLVHRGRGPSYQRDPMAMRECLMLQAEGKPLNDAFRKCAKHVVASPNTRKASFARRKHAANFKCPIDGCNDDFTRKHNLDNHLRSHCGITDLMCDVCHLGFTTLPVWKRHKKNCRHPSTL